MRNLFHRGYGAGPLHLLALVACFALTGYVVSFLVGYPLFPRIVIWFLAAVIAHDLVLFPLYALADRSGHLLRTRAWPVSPLNYVRIPALGAGLTLLLFLPGIIQQGAATYLAATGQTQAPFLARWLLLTAAMFGISAILYAVRSRRATAPSRAAARKPKPAPPQPAPPQPAAEEAAAPDVPKPPAEEAAAPEVPKSAPPEVPEAERPQSGLR